MKKEIFGDEIILKVFFYFLAYDVYLIMDMINFLKKLILVKISSLRIPSRADLDFIVFIKNLNKDFTLHRSDKAT